MSFDLISLPLSEIATFKYGKTIRKQDIEDTGLYPVHSGYTTVGYLPSYMYEEPQLMIVCRGAGGTGDIKMSPPKVSITNLAIVITCDESKVCKDYLYWVLKLADTYSLRTGSAQPQITINSLDSFNVVIHQDLSMQRSIADFLDKLDLKIGVNSQTNQTLEQMAQAIFKSWFVDFDPVKAKMNGEQPEGMDEATASLFPEKLVESELGLIPEGWDVGTLSDVAKYCSARTNTDTISLENYISTENMLAEKKGVTAASKLPTAKNVAAYKSGDILVSNIRPYFKKIWLAEGSGGRSNDVLGFESVSENTDSYLLNLLYQDTFFEYMTRTSKGAKMPRGDKTAIMNWEMAVPPVELREAFSAIVDKFYQLIPQNRAQNATLESLRDTLLPKLLSGELTLTDTLEVANVYLD
ncbi:restriction endonuclease subunit S [Vibrio vulnificus]|nr:restriction endonuclease subunit S [Vibrio vulnificus]ELG5188353.1 restriction endonuclease subunit S [Vibrio vulnificus]ELP8108100.1 restriction endonuclease subunit S [Vibrio vulnificus]ELR8672002.1 restriction endonuclease subunit S [Vibrio vulnificus]ELR8758663.1 restriction endonuclease subunit S [Vibrio vulnificus]